MPAVTMSVHGPRDLSLDIEAGSPKKRPGRIIVIDGRALLMRDVPSEAGFEIDALDGPVLMTRLVVTLLDQAFPAGPDAVPARHAVRVLEKTRAIQVATASAEARFEAPWTLTGTLERRDGRIEYDLRFSARSEDGRFSLAARGFWAKESTATPLDESMPLDGWTVHWLGPMTTIAPTGTTTDYAAQPAVGPWKDVGALRKWISEEPARRASRRTPVDAANPGRPESISFEAVEIARGGARRSLGATVREYQPGIDVLAEDTPHRATRKSLPLAYGLSLSTDVYREAELSGFGLVLAKENADCFSWEWFEKGNSDVYRKLRGDGTVKVALAENAGLRELIAVEFLDDIVLQCEDQSTGIVHEAHVRKGSVFRLRP